MTTLVVGPGTVLGPRPLPPDLGATACAAIDDHYTLVGDRPVAVDELWRSVLRAAAPGANRLVLICPGWWRPARINRIRRAAAGTQHVVRLRHDCHRTPADALVEITEHFLLVRRGGRPVASIPRPHGTGRTQLAEAVGRHISVGGPVLIDAAIEIPDVLDLADAIAAHCRARGNDITVTDDHVLGRQRPAPRRRSMPRRWWLPAAVSAAVLATATVSGLRAGPRVVDDAEIGVQVTEGRVSARVPAGWALVRVVAGAGSARLQVISPQDPDAAILIAQSPSTPEPAATLAAALDRQPPGVFGGLHTERRAGRDVLSYREIRSGRYIDWSVVLDGPVRIAVGCQQPAANPNSIRARCDEVLGSVRATS